MELAHRHLQGTWPICQEASPDSRAEETGPPAPALWEEL